MESLQNIANAAQGAEEDPIMKLNPTLYGAVAAATADSTNHTDPF